MAVPKKKKSHQKVFLKKRIIFKNSFKLLNKLPLKNSQKLNLKKISF